MTNVDKFALYSFNHLIYNQEISSLLTVNTLFKLLKYYILDKSIEKVNLWALYKNFPKITFSKNANEDVAKNFILFGRLKDLLSSKFNNYNWKSLKLTLYLFFIRLLTANVDGKTICDLIYNLLPLSNL